MNRWQGEARAAGYLCGLEGTTPNRAFYPPEFRSYFDAGREDGEAIALARAGMGLYRPAPWGGRPIVKPRAMVPGDIADLSDLEWRDLQKAEEAKLRTDAVYFLQYVMATGKMQYLLPEYVTDAFREQLDQPRKVQILTKEDYEAAKADKSHIAVGMAREDQGRQRRRNAWVSKMADKLGIDSKPSAPDDG